MLSKKERSVGEYKIIKGSPENVESWVQYHLDKGWDFPKQSRLFQHEDPISGRMIFLREIIKYK